MYSISLAEGNLKHSMPWQPLAMWMSGGSCIKPTLWEGPLKNGCSSRQEEGSSIRLDCSHPFHELANPCWLASMVWHGVEVWCNMIKFVWYGMAWYGMVRCSLVWKDEQPPIDHQPLHECLTVWTAQCWTSQKLMVIHTWPHIIPNAHRLILQQQK